MNDELVFRFPKRLDVWPELNREVGFLMWAADRLPLPVPRYLRVAPQSPAGPHGYAVYRYLRGRRMNITALPPAGRSAAAERIADFLEALHRLRPPEEIAALLPREDARLVAEEYLGRFEREIAPKLEADEARAVRRHFTRYLSTPANFAFRPVVLHADLSSDHLLTADDRLTAVLDFGDVSWGDRDYDFHYLLLDFGDAFALDVARRYRHPDLEHLLVKIRYFALADQIGTILEGPGRPLAGQLEAAWNRVKTQVALAKTT